MNCPYCNNVVNGNVKYCPNCGSSLLEETNNGLSEEAHFQNDGQVQAHPQQMFPRNSTPNQPNNQYNNVMPANDMKRERPKKKGSCLKTILIVVGALFLLSIVGSMFSGSGSKKDTAEQNTESGREEKSAGGESQQPPAVENASDEAAETETETAAAAKGDTQTVYHVGDILHDGNMDIVYAASGDYNEDNEYMQPQEGKKYIFMKFAFINTSDKKDSSISFYSFDCYADGYAVDAYYGGEEDLSATLSAGRSTEGNIYFEVPVDAQDIEVEYSTNFFTDKKIKFVFEGNNDSGYVLEKNTTATDGAQQVGDTLEGKTLNITYLSCQEDSSDNMFITPRDGYTYVTCEFEFENVSDSDVSLSYFSFDCFADGISCDQAYFRDDTISATLSSGRKAKGTVTFEVPKDAEVVEVEYLTNYWTSKRVVFNASNY